MAKRLLLFCSLLLFTLSIGCNGARTTQKADPVGSTGGDMSVLSLRGDTSNMSRDQIVELERIGRWMDRDIIKQLKRAGYNAKLLKSRKDFNGSGHLLIIDVAKFRPGNRAARAFAGFGAGGSSLDLQYKLLDSHGVSVSAWDDGVGSSKGGTYCAQTLNRNTIKKLRTILN